MVMQKVFWLLLWTHITHKTLSNLITLDRCRSHVAELDKHCTATVAVPVSIPAGNLFNSETGFHCPLHFIITFSLTWYN